MRRLTAPFAGLLLSAIVFAGGARAVTPSTFLLLFASGSSTVRPEDERIIGYFVDFHAQRPNSRVAISGHTDSAEASDSLAQARAQAVFDRLVAAGIPASRMSIIVRGDRNPLAPTAPGTPESQNRRVEVMLE